MKIFFFYIGTPSPIIETELELIRKHERSGDKIRVIQCTGNLPSCHWNQSHINSQCAMCRSKFKNGWKKLNTGENVELKHFPLLSHKNYDFPDVFDSVDDIKQYQYDNQNIGYGVASTLISILQDHRFNTHKYHNEIIRELRTAIEIYNVLKLEFKEFKPDKVYFFNGRITTHLPAKLLCKRLGIEYLAYEVASKHNKYRLVKNATVHDVISDEEINLLISNWNMEQKKIGESFFKQKRSGVDLENAPSFIKDQSMDRLPKEFNRNKKNIAIFSGTIDEYAGIEGWNKLYEPDETAGLYKILESFESDDQYFFYLRVHPNLKKVPATNSQLSDISELSSRFSNLHVIWPNEIIDSYALMDACEKIITFSSTMGVEATYWGKPSILAGRAAFENFNCAYMPKTHNELVKLIEGDIKPLSADSSLKYAFWVLSYGVPFEYFKVTGYKNGHAMLTLDGDEIKSDVFPRLWHWIHLFPSRVQRVVMEPSLILIKLKKILGSLPTVFTWMRNKD